MTIIQIEKIREYLERILKIEENPSVKSILQLNTEISNFLGEDYNRPSLCCEIDQMLGSVYDCDIILNDLSKIKAVLEGTLARTSKYSEVCNILGLIDEGKCLSDDYKSQQKFIANVYYKYGKEIYLDDSIVAIAKDSIKHEGPFDLNFGETKTIIDKVVIEGILCQLNKYAESILNGKDKKVSQKKEPKSVNIYNNVTANAINNNIITVEEVIQNARQNVEDAGLSDKQYHEVLEKLNELEELSKCKATKRSRWEKAKDIIKWLLEQGIQVAGIVLPVIANIMQNII